MNKDRIIEILEDYEYFVDDDYGGSYQHINCSQRACTPMGILQILDYIDKLESNWKTLKEFITKMHEYFLYTGVNEIYKHNIEEYPHFFNLSEINACDKVLSLMREKINELEGDK